MATPIRTLSAPIVQRAALESFLKLDPRVQWRNPVMFVVWVGSVLVTLIWLAGTGKESSAFVLAVALWLWFTILFANFAESVAEGRGKAQAAALRGTRRDVMAKKLSDPARKQSWSSVAGSTLRQGDFVYVPAGEVIPGDGEVVEGEATVDESAITGITSPAGTYTKSPLRRVDPATLLQDCFLAGSDSFFAITSRRVPRSAAACALPRPSATLSAKFAKTMVNQSHRATARTKPELSFPVPAIQISVTSTLPTHTTNITGFRHCTRGSSLTNDSSAARCTMEALSVRM